jgi:hypothetical protein
MADLRIGPVTVDRWARDRGVLGVLSQQTVG